MTPEQSKAARALLNWTQDDLARASGISKPSIISFEKGGANTQSETHKLIWVAFTRADIDFPDGNTVRKKTDYVEVLKGPNALKDLWDDIFASLKDNGGEVLITNVDEKRTLDIEKSALTEHLERLKKHHISERLLSCEGDTYFLMPHDNYRWISKELFTLGMSSYIYQGKVALQLWENSLITLIHSKDAYEAEKKRFEYMWDNALIPTLKMANKK